MTGRLKRTLAIISAVVVLTITIALVACTPDFTPLNGGEPNAKSESNNGYVVKQGEYYYFINGYTASSSIEKASDNKYGTVLKGAIMRAKKNASGGFDAGAGEVVVPMMVNSSNTEQGFSIFGEYIYYTTPSTKKDKYGDLQTAYQEFNRCKITGADNENIATLSGDVSDFKFTPDALIYLEGTDLKRVDYKTKKTTTVAEKVTGQVFPASVTYVPGELSPSAYVYYTVTPEKTDGKFNELYAVTGNADPVKLIGGGTFGENISITVKPMYVMTETDDGVTLYYEKTDNTDGRSDALGLFGVKLGSNGVAAIDVNGEKQFTVQSGLSVMPYTYDDGILVDTADAQSKYFYFSNVDENLNVIGEDVKYRYPSGFTLSIYGIYNENGAKMLYYTQGSALYRIALKEGDGGNNFDESSAIYVTGNVKADWLEVERIGNDIFILHSKYLTYVHVFDVTSVNAEGFDGVEGLQRKDLTLLGKMTKDDKESYDKMVEEEDKEAEENK